MKSLISFLVLAYCVGCLVIATRPRTKPSTAVCLGVSALVVSIPNMIWQFS